MTRSVDEGGFVLESNTHVALGGARLLYSARLLAVPDDGGPHDLAGLLAKLADVAGAALRPGALRAQAGGVVSLSSREPGPLSASEVFTDVRLTRRPDGVEVEVETSALPGAGCVVAGPAVPPPAAPGVVGKLLAGPGWRILVHGEQVDGQVLDLTPSRLQPCARVLGSASRLTGVVVIGSRPDGSWPADPQAAASALAGVASVWAFNHSDDALVLAASVLPGGTPSVPAPGVVALHPAPVTRVKPRLFRGWRGLSRHALAQLCEAALDADRRVRALEDRRPVLREVGA